MKLCLALDIEDKTNKMYSYIQSPDTSPKINTKACPKGMTKISMSGPFVTGDYKNINIPVGIDLEHAHIIVEADVREIKPSICHLKVIKPSTSKIADVVPQSVKRLALDPRFQTSIRFYIK